MHLGFYRFAKALVTPFYYLAFRVRVEGEENVPANGGIILCANHISNHDPLVVGLTAPRPVRFMAKHQLFGVPVLKHIVDALGAFPVNREKPSPASLKKSIEILQTGGCFGIFPEGTRRKGASETRVHPGTAYLALKTGAPVIPVGISSKYRFFGPLVVRFGKPVDLSAFEGRKAAGDVLEEASETITAAIAALVDEGAGQ